MVWQYRKKNHFKYLRSNSVSPRIYALVDKILDAFARRAVGEHPSLLFDEEPIEPE